LALRVNIAKLKKNLEIEIKNVRGVGYKIIWKRVINQGL
jgi:DNA-binding response OmpR family regulator